MFAINFDECLLTGVEADSEAILDEIIKADSWKWVYSQVIEERIIGSDYHAIVHVSDRGSDVSHFISSF